ncbi:MAG: tetratricopeptide repeat protein [Planctomycetota bacterium]|jgi:tetratricopeptide (TPR) repeat protein
MPGDSRHLAPRGDAAGRLAAAAAALLLLACAAARGQSLDDQLDEQRYLDGLVTLRLPDVLEQYIATHPAEDVARQGAFDIARQRMILADPATPLSDRLLAVEHLSALRHDLLRMLPADPRRAGWMTDQAADLWSEVLSVEACGLTALLGVPTASQRSRASSAAASMNELTALAEIEIDEALRVIESMPGFADDVALRRRRARLADVERDQRIPFFRGLAALVHAELNVDDLAEQRELREIAAELLVPLGDRLDGPPAADALLYGGIALQRLGQTDEAVEILAQCRQHSSADPFDRFAAALAELMAVADTNDPSAVLARLDELDRQRPHLIDPLERLLLADRRAMQHRTAAEGAAEAERTLHLDAAANTYLDLLADGDVAERSWLESSVRERLRQTIGADLPLDELPPMVSIAQAAELDERGDSRDEAVALYEQVLARTDLDDRDRAAALFGLAQSRLRRGEMIVAAAAFIDLARDHPAQREAERAVEIGVALARDLAQADPTNDAAAAVFRDGLDLLVRRYPNLASIDDWRSLGGRVALSEERFEDALALFGQVGPDANAWPDAIMMLAIVCHARREQAPDPSARRDLDEALIEQIAVSRDRLEGSLDGIEDVTELDRRRRHLAALRILEADVRREQGDANEAVRILDGIDDEPVLTVAMLGEALRVRLLSYRALARPADAMAEARRLVERAPDAAEATLASLLTALRRDAENLLALSRDDEADALVSEMLLPLAEVLEGHLVTRGRGAAVAWAPWRDIADARRLARQFSLALVIYDELLSVRAGDLAALVGRGECLFGLGVLDQTGRNTHKIVPRILRLRREDPELGGDRLRRGFERLQGKYS